MNMKESKSAILGKHTYEPIAPGKPRQIKALAMKAISAQKRAVFTNVCCILLCPLLMVGFAAAFGKVILGLIQKSTPISGNTFVSEIRNCVLLQCECNE